MVFLNTTMHFFINAATAKFSFRTDALNAGKYHEKHPSRGIKTGDTGYNRNLLNNKENQNNTDYIIATTNYQ
jgi:hypothetical protein